MKMYPQSQYRKQERQRVQTIQGLIDNVISNQFLGCQAALAGRTDAVTKQPGQHDRVCPETHRQKERSRQQHSTQDAVVCNLCPETSAIPGAGFVPEASAWKPQLAALRHAERYLLINFRSGVHRGRGSKPGRKD